MPQNAAKSTDIEGFVFVITYGRSGSTLVQNLLNAIDGYCIRGENSDAVGPLAKAWVNLRDNAVMRSFAKSGRPTPVEEPWYGAELTDPDRYGKALAEVFVDQILVPPAGTRVAGFKEIRWGGNLEELTNVLDYLSRFLAPAKFIINTRDLEEVMRSGWWSKMKPERVRTMLTRQETAFREYMAQHPDTCHHIHYNDYIADHDKLRGLFDFLGEEYQPELVRRVMSKPLTHMKNRAG